MFLTRTCDWCFQRVRWSCVIQSGTTETNTSVTHSRATRERGECVSSCICVGPVYQVSVLSSAERREDSNPWSKTRSHTHTHTCEMVCLRHMYTHPHKWQLWHNGDNSGLSIMTLRPQMLWHARTHAHTELCHTSSPSQRPVDYLPIWLQPFSPLRN